MKRILLIGFAACALAGCFDPNMTGQSKDLNDERIEQNNKCLKAGMSPELTGDNKIVCGPSAGTKRLRDYYEYLEAERVIREKTGKPLPKKFSPADAESFETKSKVTE